MPLSAPAPRRSRHHRNITMQGYLRDDGLWDIEGHLTDHKAIDFGDHYGNIRKAGDFIHDMWLRLTVNDQRVIQAVEVAMDATPFPTCVDVRHSLDALVGEQVGKGWREVIRTKVARLSTCTHIAELLVPLASAMFQTMSMSKDRKSYADDHATATPETRPFFLDGCYSWRSDGPIVQVMYPQFAVRRHQQE